MTSGKQRRGGRVKIDERKWPMIRNTWYVAGLSKEFPVGELQGHTIVGQPIVMWRTRTGRIAAFDGRCSHKRFPLWEGKLLDNDILECAYHGFCYNAAGECVQIPAQASGGSPRKASKVPIPAVERDGVVWLWPGDPSQSNRRGVPPTPEIGSKEYDSRDSGPMHVPANFRLLIENLLDITHFYPLHNGNIGDIANSFIPVQLEREVVGGNTAVMTTRRAYQYTLPPMYQRWFGYSVVDRNHTHRVVSPALTRVELRIAPPGRLGTNEEKGYVLYHSHTPIDDSNHVWRWIMNCRADLKDPESPSRPLVELIAEGFPGVVEQDRWALEKQHAMFAHADNGYEEVHIKTDGAVVMLRRELAELAAEESEESEGNVGDGEKHRHSTRAAQVRPSASL
jgi:phenylpropionate dioxygenase-like ring-hydroxylating dioxygenase large terminal subunit